MLTFGIICQTKNLFIHSLFIPTIPIALFTTKYLYMMDSLICSHYLVDAINVPEGVVQVVLALHRDALVHSSSIYGRIAPISTHICK